jgi:hypothetical protein
MENFVHQATDVSPEIYLSPGENRFIISGNSAPEDVREIYYPVLAWMKEFIAGVKENNTYTDKKPLVFKLDLEYFNSSSAKFLFDIFSLLKDLNNEGIPVVIEWHYDAEDSDLLEAGEDLALLCEIEFKYCPKPKNGK